MVCHKWGVIVTDETFEPLFVEFLAHFRRYEVQGKKILGTAPGRIGPDRRSFEPAEVAAADYSGSGLPACSLTMYSAYQSGQFVSY